MCGKGYEETFTISQLSPKSAIIDQSSVDGLLQTSQTANIDLKIEPSISINIEKLQINDNDGSDEPTTLTKSADPIRSSRAISTDEIPTSNNEIDNHLEIHNKRKYYDIHPTKTISYLRSDGEVMLSSEGFGDRLEFRLPGEGKRVPKARALAPMGPRIRPTAVQPIFATATPKDGPRQNSDIQNIITGIVKLLNGNVNVQANSQLLRPGRPMASRINNRGPPRISDVPPMPEFDGPITPPPQLFHQTKTPPPYPFDRPPVHVNLPEQIVPPLNRPSFHRPLPPWQRPPRPRPPNRRPNPGLPLYKPNLPPLPDIPDISDTEEDPNDASANENETTHSENTIHNEDQSIHSLSSEVSITEPDIVKEDKQETTTIYDTSTASSSTTTTTTTTTTEAATTQKSTTQPPTSTEKATTTQKPTTTERPTTTEKPTTTERPTTTEKSSTTTEKKIEKPKNDKKKETVISEKEKTKEKVKLEDKPSNKTKNEFDQVIQIVEPSIPVRPSSTVSMATPTPTEGLISAAPTVNVTTSTPSVIESSSINSEPIPTSQSPGISYHPYRPRPGIVLDDPDFKPHGTRYRPDASVITAVDTKPPGYGEIFDVTVSAIQGLGSDKGGASVHIENVNIGHEHHQDDIIVSASGEQGFVSIDGKRTYLNLFDTSTPGPTIKPTHVQSLPQSVPPIPPPPVEQTLGTGVAIPADDVPQPPVRRPAQHPQHPHPQHPPLHRPQQGYRRPQPTVRIDTCIVGDDSTCDQTQNEKCRTEAGISSCQCRPGYARRIHRDPCRRVVSLLLNMRVDRFHDRKVAWDAKLADKDTDPYQQLSYEAVRAVDSAFSMTPFSDDFVSGSVNSIYKGDEDNPGVYVNLTVLMQETPETSRSQVAVDIQKHLLGVIRRRSNNIGSSTLWVHSPAGSVLPLHDVDECSSSDLNDCHQLATCTNTWGGFRCMCPDTTLDAAPTPSRQGRECKSCASSHCNERGVCKYASGQPYCSCSSGYYGSTCEVDGEVVGVAVGASLAAALVIALTLAALMSWSRKWSREQKAVGMGSPIFNYMAANTVKTPPVGQPPYQVTLEERMRWAQIAEAMAQASHYAPEGGQGISTRPSSAMFGGYPTLPPVPLPSSHEMSYRMGLHNHHSGTMNTVTSRANTSASHHNLYGYSNQMASESTSSEASSHVQERADLLVPRPKSRASRSMHNQTGIYYDVDYENAPEAIYGTKGIPLSTYTVSRGPPFYRT
ncbi:unnamed protein product [Arctia plantaginis]|uniref:EGF-like domain-containing protein n=1 Tax=Arctia plantaginis TaxID=874455 RepID=A0A8S0ZWL1_ARCPL|nr:unnamed protein product [Arctia plantaginis]